MMALEIRMFGGLALTQDGAPFSSIPSVTARSLLAYLVVNRDRPHTRHLLAGLFWPESPDASARRRLSQALWHIRRIFHPRSILHLEGDAVQFAPDFPVWIDSEEFNQRYVLISQDSAKGLEHAEACVDIYRGEFLTGYYDEWIITERERFRNLYLAVLGRLITGYKSQGRFERALTHTYTLVSQDPWNEDGYHEIILLCHLLDRNAEAIKQFQICKRIIQIEMGVEPSAEIQALALEIARQVDKSDAVLLPIAAQTSQAPLLERPDRIPLVGRKIELASILSRVETAARGEGGLILIYGEAGVGKTRLLQELARNVQWRGLRTAWGRCYELAGPPAYQPLVEIFRTDLSALNETMLEPLWRAELARLLPELATNETPTTLDPDEEQKRLLEAITRGFRTLSQETAYLVILEDAHWMDPASLAAIRYLLPRLVNMSMLMVISLRGMDLSPPQAEVFAALENTRLPQRLELGRLNQAETGELVRRSLNLEQLPVNFSARLFAETEGNPFFLTETLRTLLDEGLLYRDENGVWRTPYDESTQNYAELPLPKGVAQSIERRLERLPEPSREAMNLASVIGRGIFFDLWRLAIDIPETELLVIGDELCNRGLLLHGSPGVSISQESREDYSFVHDLIRRVTYDRMAPPRRRFYHRRVAEGLVRLAPENVESLAYHWTAAQVWDMALDTHKQAGDRAARVFANAEAVEHYSRALEALERLPGLSLSKPCYDIHLALERVFDLQGDRQAQTRELDILSELSEAMNDDRLRAMVALRQAKLSGRISDYLSEISDASRAVCLAQSAGDVQTEAESHWEWGWALLLKGEYSSAKSQFEQSLALARSREMRRLEADGLHGLGTIALAIGDYPEAKRYYHQVLDIGNQVDIRQRVSRSLSNLGYIATAQGDHVASKTYNEEALQIDREIGDQQGASIVIQNLADEFLAEGEFSKAKSYLEESLAIQNTIQAHENAGVTLRSLGLLFHQLGDYSQAQECYQEAFRLSNELGIRLYQGQTLAFLSLLAHQVGKDQEAVELSRQGLIIAEKIDDRLAQGWLLDALGHASFGLGQFDRAEEAYQKALALRQEVGETHKTTESLAGLARIALAQDRLQDAREYVEEILRLEKVKGLAGTNDPFRVYLTCFQVLEACQDPRSDEILTTAYQRLTALKANIEDQALRESFLENVAIHREIISAYQDRQPRQDGSRVQVKLPRVGISKGRALQGEDYVLVTWTVDMPEDQAISNKTERRQSRLLRLLDEARAQGAAPTHDHLAQALGVTRRTIERDLIAIRMRFPQ